MRLQRFGLGRYSTPVVRPSQGCGGGRGVRDQARGYRIRYVASKAQAWWLQLKFKLAVFTRDTPTRTTLCPVQVHAGEWKRGTGTRLESLFCREDRGCS